MTQTVTIETPVMTQELFAQKAGVSKDTVRGMVETKQLPSKKIGKRRFINIAALTSQCLADASASDQDQE